MHAKSGDMVDEMIERSS